MELELECGPLLVLIQPDAATRPFDDVIKMSDQEKKNLEKQQDRGKIVCIGSDVKFWQVDDYVSFYRNAATPIKENGQDYLTIHWNHIQVRFKEKIVRK